MATNHKKAKLVVSPGKENEDRDYRYKRSEYAARGIAEYWIVDPEHDRVTVLVLANGLYGAAVFCGSDRRHSERNHAKSWFFTHLIRSQ
jgi:hypothetical protein